jgi:GntR family transcriptional regulator, transcriptional repressor for pyruvate dehydrogenase complex
MRKIISAPIRAKRLSEIVETHLKELILNKRIKPGQKLPTEKQISEQFGVSIVTAREALKGLEVLGLLEKKKGKGGGIFVGEVKSDSIKTSLNSFFNARNLSSNHLTELRMIVEPASVKLALAHITSQEIRTLDQNIKYCEEKIAEAGHVFSRKEFFDIENKNIEFHRLIAEATHNPILALTTDYVMDLLLRYKKSALKPDLILTKGTITDHRKILVCINKRDADAAGSEMSLHLTRLQEYFVKMVPRQVANIDAGETTTRRKYAE